ncbi:hypothetical protein ACWDF1_11400 [Streptomyces coelicoflavus]|uniref:hypothetical protein n=1 Tax=Streptomyces coelicoflavus TaxID=285562 RepID=UPI0036C685C9
MRLPSGVRYWTVVDENYVVVSDADAFLRHVRFGRDQEELTTRTYAGHVALYLRWCTRTGRDWRAAEEEFGLFLIWLKFGSKEATGVDRPTGPGLVLAGPGAEPARQPARIQNRQGPLLVGSHSSRDRKNAELARQTIAFEALMGRQLSFGCGLFSRVP